MAAIRLSVFTRYPVPGTTKTRLIPSLGAQGAARLQRRLTEHMVDHAEQFVREHKATLCIYYTGAERSDMMRWLGQQHHYIPQADGDLGSRLIDAVENAFIDDHHAIITGIDSPDITPQILSEAANCLVQHDVVLGPACDGGYYLIGLRAGLTDGWQKLFQGIDWGSEQVFAQTSQIIENKGLSLGLLPELSDIDTEDDLCHWEDACAGHPVSAADSTLSVIIPVLNEKQAISANLERVMTAENIEVIAVDGGSSDGTLEVLHDMSGIKVLQSERGRGHQLIKGVQAATGDILLFVHADTLLPLGYDSHVRRAIDVQGVQAGAFSFNVDADLFGIRVVEFLTNFRSRYRQMPYGDQALFMKKEAYETVGGMAPLPLLEDVDLVSRLRARHTIHTLDMPVLTSARRWQSYGIWATYFLNQVTLLGYHLGISPDTLAKWYRRSVAP
jgi:rSAM/selenodomain-associated transferase 2/rSAM/selenodomain-associated transferase 1